MYTVMKKLLLIGGDLNKVYHFFVDNYFMSVLLVHHLHQLSTYITRTVRRNRKLLLQQFKNKCIANLAPFSHVFSVRRNHKENSIIILSSHATAQEEEVQGRHGGISTNKTKNNHIVQLVYGCHRFFRHDAVHLFG
jgi:hypothetical protein